MSKQYDEYLRNHKANVVKGFEWIKKNIPKLLEGCESTVEWLVTSNHDMSKSSPEEYKAYDNYFYGGNRSYAVVQDFKLAWLHHIHHNPHHWQYWILHNDEPGEGMVILDMPYHYILEMVCDWWAFSWAKGDLYEIFNWYDAHKDYMKLSDMTRRTVERILEKIRKKLEKNKWNW